MNPLFEAAQEVFHVKTHSADHGCLRTEIRVPISFRLAAFRWSGLAASITACTPLGLGTPRHGSGREH